MMDEQEKANAVTAAVAGSLTAATADIASMIVLVGHEPPWRALTFAFFFVTFPGFLLCFSAFALSFVGLVRITRMAAIRWLYFPICGVAIGFGLPLVVGPLAATPRIGAFAGLLGGVASAFGWGRYRVLKIQGESRA